MKRFITLIASAIIILGSLSFTLLIDNNKGKLEVIFLNVSQGDSILIKIPDEQNILIDGGPDNTVIEKLGEYLPFYDKEIDLIILTHPHDDHVTGLVEVLKRYQVKKILMTGVLHTAPNYLAFLKQIKGQNVAVETVNKFQNISLGENLSLELLYPSSDFSGLKVENLNNTSIVAKLVYGSTSFLLTGDAEEEVEKELISNKTDLKADVIKIGHHGSSTSTSEEFLKIVNPQYSIISVGAANKFNHPSLRTINRLEKNGIKIFRTDEKGDIILISDGSNITIK